MCRTEDAVTRYAPLYIHTFRLIAPHWSQKALQSGGQYRSYNEIPCGPKRLRWCREQKGLLQRQVAESVGLSRQQYMDLENGTASHCPNEIADKLATLFGVPVFDLLDDYNRFLYEGQGKLIQEYRTRLGLGESAFAKEYHIPARSLSAWELEQKRISRASWERYFMAHHTWT